MNLLLQEDQNLDTFEILTEGQNSRPFLRGVLGRANFPNQNKRVYPLHVMKEAVEQVKPLVQTRGFFGELGHPCLTDKNFDVLSKAGWAKFETLKVGDEVATFDEENNIVYQPITDVINEPYKGKAYHFKGRNIDSTFTGPHRFYLENRYGKREIVTAEEIYSNRNKYNKHKIIKNGNWVGNDLDYVIIPGTEKVPEELKLNAKVFFGFMGIYLSEGSVRHFEEADNGIYIHQNEGEVSDKIRLLLKELGFEVKEYYTKRTNSVGVTFVVREERLNDYLRKLGNCYKKFIPAELKEYSSMYLEELLEWFILGDGRREKNGKTNVFSTSKKLVEDLHEILIKIGGSGNWTEIDTKEDYFFAEHLIEAKNKSTLYQLNISSAKGIYLDERFLEIEEIDHDGNIYCITVPNGNFYMKQNGKAFLTGNSTPKVREEHISHFISKLELAEDGSLIGEIKPTSSYYGQMLESYLRDGLKLGVSTRATGGLKPYKGPLGEGLMEVQPGLKFFAIDVVSMPSAGTYPDIVTEDVERVIMGSTKKFRDIWDSCFS